MYLSQLSLTHFRNYQHLELDFHNPLTLLQGQNAQGKTNLLEAIYYLATSKPVHAQTEREVVDWQAEEEPIPYSRIAAQVITTEHNRQRPLQLEIILTQREDRRNFKKQIKINGVSKRSMDLVGMMRAVLFLPEDIKLVVGSPSERRRYLDIALCQIDRQYCRSLSQYQKILVQRNSLLKNLREQGAYPNADQTKTQLGFWDEQLVQLGSEVMTRRFQFTQQLQAIAHQRHTELTDEREALSLYYVPSFNPGHLSEYEYANLKERQAVYEVDRNRALPSEPIALSGSDMTPSSIHEAFLARLHSRRSRELAAGNTLYGPHRDDLRLDTNGRDLRTYGSRGQQRTAALSLKLAEVQAMTEAVHDAPLLLLDDVMSELDAQRRSTLLQALNGVEQAIITTTDWDDFTSQFREQARLLRVADGVINEA